MANDVGNGFAERQGEGSFLLRAEDDGAFGIAFIEEYDTCGVERDAGGFDFGGETAGSVTADGFADLGEGSAGDAFYVGDLGGGAGGIERDKAAGQLSLEDDDGKSMAKNIVEVACDTFTFGDSGEREILLLRGAEFAFGALLLRIDDIAPADSDNEEDGNEGVRPTDVEGAIGGVEIEEVSFGEDD